MLQPRASLLHLEDADRSMQVVRVGVERHARVPLQRHIPPTHVADTDLRQMGRCRHTSSTLAL
jgi:hypothetical protein